MTNITVLKRKFIIAFQKSIQQFKFYPLIKISRPYAIILSHPSLHVIYLSTFWPNET